MPLAACHFRRHYAVSRRYAFISPFLRLPIDAVADEIASRAGFADASRPPARLRRAADAWCSR